MSSERYIRQTILRGFGKEGQAKLANAKVLVVGAGGLGVPVLTYLNAMGLGMLGVVDNDLVSISNLHRQVLYDESDIGKPKVEVAVRKLKAQNPETNLKGHKTFLDKENALQIIRNYDVVIDATDNFPTRYLINDVCVLLKKPFVYGALHGFEGQVSVFNFKGGPTYRCLFPNMPKAHEVPNCNEHGVLGILPGIIGNLQALEAIKVLTGVGEVLSGKLLLYNGLSQTVQQVKFPVVNKNLNIEELASDYSLSCQLDVPSIETAKFESLLKEGEIHILDVRTQEEYVQLHLPNSVNIPLSDLEQNIKSIPKKSPVYVICQSGVRSRKAISLLQGRISEQKFINVKGGLNKLFSYVDFH